LSAQQGRSAPGQRVDDAVRTGCADVVDGPGQSGRCPQQTPERISENLDVHAVPVVLAGVVRPVGGDPVDRQQRSVQDHECLACRGAGRRGDVRCEGREYVDRLDDVPVHGGGTDTKTGSELGVGMPTSKVGQDQQSLAAGRKAPPPRPPLQTSGGQQTGQPTKRRTGQIDPRWVDKHVKLRADRLILVDNPSTRSFTHLRTQPSPQPRLLRTRLEKAQCHFQ
jgi:hypothetical protein